MKRNLNLFLISSQTEVTSLEQYYCVNPNYCPRAPGYYLKPKRLAHSGHSNVTAATPILCNPLSLYNIIGVAFLSDCFAKPSTKEDWG